ncbi:MAG: hypothetical protein NTU95_01250 [Methanothrix sp.]|nr:hypothetical protein [Methanothrix sp.]
MDAKPVGLNMEACAPKKYRSIKEIEKTYLPKCFQRKAMIEIEDPRALGKRMAEETFDKVRDKFLQVS